MFKEIKHTDYLFFKREELYHYNENDISIDEFKTGLLENKEVSVILNEYKLFYNEDRTKLKLVIYSLYKKFINLKKSKLKKVVPKKRKIHTGFTIDLVHKNVYSFIINHNLKNGTSQKIIRCNSFYNNLFNRLNSFVKDKKIFDILCNELNLIPDVYYNISNILSVYYLRSRNIEYYNNDNVKYFMDLHQKNRKKICNTDIYSITQDILGIKNNQYVKLFYEGRCFDGMFYHMVLFDLFEREPVFDKSSVPTLENTIPYDKIFRLKFFIEKYKNLYNIKYSDCIDTGHINENLNIIDSFHRYGVRINIEHIKTLDKIKHILNGLLYNLTKSMIDGGYVIHNHKTIDIISKHLGDNYVVNYEMVPKGYADLLENTVLNKYNIFEYALTEYQVCRSDGIFRTVLFNQHIQNVFNLRNNYLYLETENSKFKKLLNKFGNNFEEYYELFSTTCCFSEERFLILCQEDEELKKPYKYISKL